jgi:mono/diheme cytochrome c family protein
MKTATLLLTAGSLMIPLAAGADAVKGKELFEAVDGGNCRVCHSTTSTKVVGPGLGGLMSRHSEEWVRMFITDPQKTWETDHPETIELKKRIRGGMVKKATSCQKKPLTEEGKRDLIDFFKTLAP